MKPRTRKLTGLIGLSLAGAIAANVQAAPADEHNEAELADMNEPAPAAEEAYQAADEKAEHAYSKAEQKSEQAYSKAEQKAENAYDRAEQKAARQNAQGAENASERAYERAAENAAMIRTEQPNVLATIDPDQIEGKEVFGVNGEKLGDVDSVRLKASTKERVAIIGIDGIVGANAKEVAVPLRELRMMEGTDTIESDLSMAQLKERPDVDPLDDEYEDIEESE